MNPAPDNTQAEGWLHRTFHVTPQEVEHLTRSRPNPAARTKFILYLVGGFLTAITLFGALLGYMRAYNRFMKADQEPPELHPLRPIVRFAMIAGAILIWVVLFGASVGLGVIGQLIGFKSGVLLGFVAVNLFFSSIVFFMFQRWRNGINNALIEGNRFGSARFA